MARKRVLARAIRTLCEKVIKSKDQTKVTAQ